MKDRTSAVVRSIYSLKDRTDYKPWPTAVDIANHLKIPRDEVDRCLRELYKQRIMKKRQRNGFQVWMPWEEI